MNSTNTKKVAAYLRSRLIVLSKELAEINTLLQELEPIKPAISEQSEPYVDWELEVAWAIRQNGGACTKAAITKLLGEKFNIGHQRIKNEVSTVLLFNVRNKFVKVKANGHYEYRLNKKR